MDRFLELSVFVAVAEEEGFASAARRLQMSAPAVTRAVASLEKRLGIKLLDRTTRHVRVTSSGEQYLADARRILTELDAADAGVVGAHTTPAGVLSVTAPSLFGRLFVVPGVVDYLKRYPKTRVSIALLDRVVNLLEEGFDVGIRIGALPDSTLRAVKIGNVRWVLCATPGYLAKAENLSNPGNLAQHPVIAVSPGMAPVRWTFQEHGKSRTVQLDPSLCVSSTEGALTAAKLGFGITRLLSYQIADAVTAGELVPILDQFEPRPIPIQIIHREGRIQSAKVRGFVELMMERLSADSSLR